MGLYDEITEARGILGLEEAETLKSIKEKYKTLIKKHHPDISKEGDQVSRDEAEKIISAYKLILSYCDNYKFSFERDEVSKYISVEEYWREKFGKDTLWSDKS